jgi:ABC-type amino acid transport substrate-binding protein
MATIDRRDVVAPQSAAGLSPRGTPLQWRWLLPVTVSASVTAWLVSVSSGEVHGAARVPLLAAGAVFTATAAGVPLWQQRRAAQARADAIASAQTARAQMRIALEDALEPFTALLLQLAISRGTERSRLRGEAIQLALTSIAQLSVFAGPEEPSRPRRVRVCLFLVNPGPPRQLVPSSFAGRSGAPTVSFDATTRAGQALLRILDDGWVLVDDTDTRTVVPWWDEERKYMTYAAGPVPGTDATPVGLLTVDSLVPGDLTGLDLPLLRLIAHLLSLALQT